MFSAVLRYPLGGRRVLLFDSAGLVVLWHKSGELFLWVGSVLQRGGTPFHCHCLRVVVELWELLVAAAVLEERDLLAQLLFPHLLPLQRRPRQVLLADCFSMVLPPGQGVVDLVLLVDALDVAHDEGVVVGGEEGAVGGVGVALKDGEVVLEDGVDLGLEAVDGTGRELVGMPPRHSQGWFGSVVHGNESLLFYIGAG